MTRAALAAGAGAGLAICFPSPDLGWLAWIALAPLILLALTAPSARRAAIEGWIAGLAFHGITFAWWFSLLETYGRLSAPEASGIFLLLAAYIAVYAAAFCAGARAIAARRGRAWALMAAPALWTGLELARSRLLTGLPWSLLGATQHRIPVFLQVADLGGVYAVSLTIAAANAALAWGILAWWSRRPGGRAPRRWAVPAALLLIPVLSATYGAARLSWTPASIGTVRVGIVQGNVAQDRKWEADARESILAAHVEATRRAAAQGARLIVWPESSVPLPLTAEPRYRGRLETLARDLGADLLVGSEHYTGRHGPEEKVFNSAFLLPGTADSAEQRYDKVHLVPYGEYVPMKRWLGILDRLVAGASDFSAGESAMIVEGGGARLGVFICFEAVFPDLVRRFERGGAQLLVNITNDAMLGDTAGPPQHLALAAIRAVEGRRWMVRAANTGISAVVDASGRVVDRAPFGSPAVIVEDVPLIEERTIYTRVGDALGWGCVIVALASLIAPRALKERTSWTRNYFDDTPP